MSSIGNPAGVPNINQPFTSPAGIITRPWLLFLQNLFERTGGASGEIVGTTTDDDAPPGCVGEYLFSDVLSGAGVPLTSAVNADMTALDLSAGDWDATLQGLFFNMAANATLYTASLSLVSQTLDVTLGRFSQLPLTVTGSTAGVGLSVPSVRFSLAAPATIYAVQNCTFSAGAVSAFGRISARRPR